MAAVTVLDQFTGRSINKFTIHKTQQFGGWLEWIRIKINSVVNNSPQSLKICCPFCVNVNRKVELKILRCLQCVLGADCAARLFIICFRRPVVDADTVYFEFSSLNFQFLSYTSWNKKQNQWQYSSLHIKKLHYLKKTKYYILLDYPFPYLFFSEASTDSLWINKRLNFMLK